MWDEIKQAKQNWQGMAPGPGRTKELPRAVDMKTGNLKTLWYVDG